MTKLLAKLAIVAMVGLSSSQALAQLLPPTKKAARVAIINGPNLEMSLENWAIVRWTSTNPGGDDDHYGVVHYGTQRNDLNQTAQSHIRLNRSHAETVFRVRVPGLKPQTTYYYWVTSMGGDGQSDGVKSAVSQFTTPAPGNRIVNN